MTPEQIKLMIESGIEGSEALVEGDGSHFFAHVISDLFDGVPMIKQLKIVYATLGDSMEEAIHAFSIQTYTTEAWEKAKKLKVLS